MESAEHKRLLRLRVEAFLDRGEEQPLRSMLEILPTEIIRSVLAELEPYESRAILKMMEGGWQRGSRQRIFEQDAALHAPLRRVGFWLSLLVLVASGWMPREIFKTLPEAFLVLAIWLPLLDFHAHRLAAEKLSFGLLGLFSQALAFIFVSWRLDGHTAAAVVLASTVTLFLAAGGHFLAARIRRRRRYPAPFGHLLWTGILSDAGALFVFIGIARLLLRYPHSI